MDFERNTTGVRIAAAPSGPDPKSKNPAQPWRSRRGFQANAVLDRRPPSSLN